MINEGISSGHRQVSEAPGSWTVIIEVGAEGGSLRLYGRHSSATWQFCRTIKDHTPQLLGEEAIRHSSSIASTWTDALALLDKYPWAELFPIDVHPDFAERVLTAATERLTRSPRRAAKLVDWRSICGSSPRRESRAPQ